MTKTQELYILKGIKQKSAAAFYYIVAVWLFFKTTTFLKFIDRNE